VGLVPSALHGGTEREFKALPSTARPETTVLTARKMVSVRRAIVKVVERCLKVLNNKNGGMARLSSLTV